LQISSLKSEELSGKIIAYIKIIYTIEARPKNQDFFTTTCLDCQETCHDTCEIKEDKDKIKCVAMDRVTGMCMKCPGKCHW